MATISRKKTKIVATLGPATSNRETLLAMMDEGVNVFRINFSHADYDDVKERVKMIRELNDEHEHNTAILADLQGPKLRVGLMEENVKIVQVILFFFVLEKSLRATKVRFI